MRFNEWDNEDMESANPEPSGHGHVCDTCGAEWDCFDTDCQPGLTHLRRLPSRAIGRQVLERNRQNETVSTVYILTLKNGDRVRCPVSVLTSKFKVIGHNFESRLKQFQELFPRAQVVDWEMVDLEDGK